MARGPDRSRRFKACSASDATVLRAGAAGVGSAAMNAFLYGIRTRTGPPLLAGAVGVTLCVSGAVTLAQGNAAGLEILQIRPNFYMIVGAGANIGAQIGPNGVVLVNAGTADASDEVVAAVAKLTTEPIRY